MTTLLEVRDIRKTFPIAGSSKLVQAINGVSFDLEHGKTLGLVGESGSGKTTVGRCIMGLTDLSEGTIRLDGTDLSAARARDPRSVAKRMQTVFQEPAESLDPRMRIGDSVTEPLLAQAIKAAARRRRLADALDTVGLPHAISRLYPGELSAGQQQRVAIARAMISEPELLILDEPTSALDPSARAEIIALLMRIQRDFGTAYLFISHDLSTVRFLSHRIAVMYLGLIVEQGPAAEVFARPRHPYSLALLSAVLLPNPHLRRASDVTLAGEIPSPIDLPKGCFLASRCPFAVDRCRRAVPPPEQVGEEHTANCIRHREVATADRSADTFEEFQAEAERILSVGAPQAA